MPIGYFDDLDDANDYFNNERLVTLAWDNLSSDENKTAVLTMAYNRLYYSNLWTLPTYAAATPAELVILKKANGEMAYYMALHVGDEDRRKGIQVQGVIKAGVVKENYHEDMLNEIPIPPIVWGLLWAYKKKKLFYAQDLTRDEDEDI